MMVAFANDMRAKQLAIVNDKRALEAARALIYKGEDDNWKETNRIRAEKAALENELAIMKRDMSMVEQREKQVAIREDHRRRNRFVSFILDCKLVDTDNHHFKIFRTVSETFIEESFAILSPRDVVGHLTLVPLRFFLVLCPYFLKQEFKSKNQEARHVQHICMHCRYERMPSKFRTVYPP